MTRLEDFEHEPGHHCGSVAMADILRHHGLSYSEPMVFGLGSGAGFVYRRGDDMSPSRQIVGRVPTLELNVAEALGLEMVEHSPRDFDDAWAGIREAIDDGRAALVRCDLAELPYWETETPFDGHRIVVVGYDDTEGYVDVADTHFEDLQRIELDTLQRARASEPSPSSEESDTKPWWELLGGEPRDLESALRHALDRNVRWMTSSEGAGGLEGLDRFREEVRDWESLEDAAWCYRFAYQCIEERGTGGGLFRYMYRNFLNEAAEYVPRIEERQLGISMGRNADAWSTLARYLEATADVLDPEDPECDVPDEPPVHHVESMAEAVYQFETTFWNQLESVVEGPDA